MLTQSFQGDNQIENLVPVLMLNQGVSCDKAMQWSSLLVEEATRGFHEVEDNLQCTFKHRPSPVTEVLLQGCKNIVMGLTHWRYVTSFSCFFACLLIFLFLSASTSSLSPPITFHTYH
jgi:hypothetical protein